MVTVRMLTARLENILTYLKHRITNAVSEGLNSRIQWVKATARGFRNQQNFINAIYFHCGKLSGSFAHLKPGRARFFSSREDFVGGLPRLLPCGAKPAGGSLAHSPRMASLLISSLFMPDPEPPAQVTVMDVGPGLCPTQSNKHGWVFDRIPAAPLGPPKAMKGSVGFRRIDHHATVIIEHLSKLTAGADRGLGDSRFGKWNGPPFRRCAFRGRQRRAIF